MMAMKLIVDLISKTLQPYQMIRCSAGWLWNVMKLEPRRW
jgi:hypothetical protein